MRKDDEAQYSAAEPSEPGEGREYTQFIEERFGRNLDINLAANAKLAIRRRIAGSLVANVGLEEAINSNTQSEPSTRMKGLSEDDVYLYPCGMSAIFNIHRTLMVARGCMKSICFGYELLPFKFARRLADVS
jgi:cystathionine gamma-synthase